MDDLIHRREALDAVTDELDMIDHVPQWVFDRLEKRLKRLPSAEPEQPTEIQDILAYLDEEVHPIVAPDDWNIYSELHDMISELSVEPERKTGKWITFDSNEEKYDDIRCSNCKMNFTVDAYRWCDIGFTVDDLKYCPNCGAYMRGEQDGRPGGD